jgi:hypothetical protein
MATTAPSDGSGVSDGQIGQELSRSYERTVNKIKAAHLAKFNKSLESLRRKKDTTKKADYLDKSRWVINRSKRNITQTELAVLRKGLNYAVTPKDIPIKDIITSTEIACVALKDPIKAQALRSEIVNIIKKAKPPSPNLTPAESKALDALRKDDTISILPADKGRATILLDKSTYVEKIQELL